MSEPIDHLEAEKIDRENLADAVKGSKKAKRTRTVIDVAREITASHQYQRFRGVLFDGFSASAVVAVHDALNDEKRAKYLAMDDGTSKGLKKMVDVAFRCMKK
jgi:hypothetical protein